jgi:hypothetical protein
LQAVSDVPIRALFRRHPQQLPVDKKTQIDMVALLKANVWHSNEIKTSRVAEKTSADIASAGLCSCTTDVLRRFASGDGRVVGKG